MEKYLEISQKWPEILALNDPIDIHDELEIQNAKCLKILEEKDDLIAELKRELEHADLMYAEEVNKQNEDIDLLVERMENQVSFESSQFLLSIIQGVSFFFFLYKLSI